MALRMAHTENGWVEGVPSEIRTVTVFRGIPYAAAPIGKNRWREPQPVENWDGTRLCDRFAPITAQCVEEDVFYSVEFDYRQREPMSEDCLYLNIWTPAFSEAEQLPVMVFIHGGGYRSGYSYEPFISGDAFCKNGVILVSITYRLGCLGFLAHPDMTAESAHGVSGNWGMLDQIAALQWVHRNIAAFGGDPDNITIFGQSAGALSVQTLVTSPLTEGLISRAIMQSAGGYYGAMPPLLPHRTLLQAEQQGKELFSMLGVHTLEEARAIPYSEILQAQQDAEAASDMGITFAPIVDGWALPYSPDQAVEQGTLRHIPYIVGCTDHENGSFDVGGHPTQDDYRSSTRAMLGEKSEPFLQITGFDENPDYSMTYGGFDDWIKPSSLAFCEYMVDHNWDQPIYYYYFSRNLPGNDHPGAFHSGDLWYTFHTIHRSRRPMNGVDYEVADAMNTYWCNFAKNGDPNQETLPHWDAYSCAKRAGMELGDRIGMINYPGTRRMHYLVDHILSR